MKQTKTICDRCGSDVPCRYEVAFGESSMDVCGVECLLKVVAMSVTKSSYVTVTVVGR